MVRTVDFNALRNNAKKVEEKKGAKKDERFYESARNNDGNAFAIIRFLPQREDEDTFFVKNFNHFFKENGKHYIEECPTSIGLPCPVCEYNGEHWGEYGDEEKKRSRKARYVTNIYVVKDKEHPEREGKVYLYNYGAKIQKKIMNVVDPSTDEDEGAKPYNVFDFMKGKNFKLKTKTVSNFANYDDSEFASEPSALCDGDKQKIEAIDKSIYSLKEFVPTKEKFKSYEELKIKFMSVLNGSESPAAAAETSRREDDGDSDLMRDSNQNKSGKKAESNPATSQSVDFFNIQ